MHPLWLPLCKALAWSLPVWGLASALSLLGTRAWVDQAKRRARLLAPASAPDEPSADDVWRMGQKIRDPRRLAWLVQRPSPVERLPLPLAALHAALCSGAIVGLGCALLLFAIFANGQAEALDALIPLDAHPFLTSLHLLVWQLVLTLGSLVAFVASVFVAASAEDRILSGVSPAVWSKHHRGAIPHKQAVGEWLARAEARQIERAVGRAPAAPAPQKIRRL